MEHAIFALAGIGVAALLCQWIAWWLKLPAILFLLLAGIFAGPILGLVDPNQLFGDLLFPFVSLAVAVILFEGSLTLKLHEIRGLERVVQNLLSIGVLVTWTVTTCASHWFIGFPWPLAFLFGALTVVTGPTVIVPLLRTVRPNATIANVLRWEGIMIDPIGALLAVLVFEVIVAGSGSAALNHTMITFTKIVVIGIVLGVVSGYFLGFMLRRHWLPDYLHNMATLMLVIGLFAFSDGLQHESGLLSVTVMGIWLANMKDVRVEQILDFKESLSILLISILFIILAARLELPQLRQLGWAAVWVFLAMQFIARPVKVWLSTLGSSLKWRERALLAWVAPRGIVAAAVSALFALRLQHSGMPMAELLVPLTFMVIIGTVVLQSLTTRPLAMFLGVAEPEPNGILFVGANSVARMIAKTLQGHDIPVILADSNWDNISAARMDGLRTFFGNAVSEHADWHLDLVGIGHMVGLSHHDERNALASLRYRGEFGKSNVFCLPAKKSSRVAEKHKIAAEHRGYILFDQDASYAKLASLLSNKGEIRSTKLTDNFSYDDYKKEYGRRSIVLFAINAKKRLYVFADTQTWSPAAGWTLIALVNNSEKAKSKDATVS